LESGFVYGIEWRLPNVAKFYEGISKGNVERSGRKVDRSPSIRYGAASKLAVVDKKVTNRVPASTRLPRVGQPLAGKEADWGEYDIASTPAATNIEANRVAARLSELTISRVTTGERGSEWLGRSNVKNPPSSG